MKLSDEDWISKVLNNIGKTVEYWELFQIKACNYINNEYPYKNKDAFLKALKDLNIPKFFCIDVENRKVLYVHNGSPRVTFGSAGIRFKFTVSSSRSLGNVLGNIIALMSGKKQKAVKQTAEDRRLPDGSYRGIDKMHLTKLKEGTYQRVVDGIAITRRNADGSYKGCPPKGWPVDKVLSLLKDRGFEYQYLETEIKGSKEKVRFVCDKGHPFKIKINAIQSSRQGCGKCQESTDETKCRKLIENLTGLKFPKTKPDWLRNPFTNRKLELDGYCENEKIAFEYDGPTHFKPIYGTAPLKAHIKRDLIKNELCAKNGVRLIRVSYKIKNIERHLRRKLSKIWPK